MNYTLKKIQLNELAAFVSSDEYNQFDVLPISLNRVESYLQNPRANPDDFILYMLFDGYLLIGFYTLLTDTLCVDNKTERFVWLSGAWVRSEYRRKGISTNLLLELFADWNGRAIYTNYAPNAKAMFDKSGKFSLLTSKKGLKLYFRFHNAELLRQRHRLFNKSLIILQLADSFLNFVTIPFRHFQQLVLATWLTKVKLIREPDESVWHFMEAYPNSAFNRGRIEYEWILSHPWVRVETKDKRLYPFSHTAKEFYYLALQQLTSNGFVESMALLKVRDAAVSIPYYYSTNNSSRLMYKAMLAYCHQIKAKSLTFYQEPLLASSNSSYGDAIFRKKMWQKYFISSSLKNSFSSNIDYITVQDGDGDCIFT